ncbi:MAG: rRNA maturation RNase YbeY [Bacteroidales bacterium]
MPVLIHYNNQKFTPPSEEDLINFLSELLENEEHFSGEINIIYVGNDEILELNKKYLNHNYFTDVLAFRYNEGTTVDGDIFINLDKVYEHSREYSTTFYDECLRVVIHGILHLTGYTDTTAAARNRMHELENHYLSEFYSKKE